MRSNRAAAGHLHQGFTARLLLLWIMLWGIAYALQSHSLIHQSSYHRLYSSRPATDATAALGKALDDRIGDLQMTLGIYPQNSVNVYIIHGGEAYQKLSGGRGKIIEFSDAFFSGDEGVIYVRSQDQISENYLHILIHEYIHWYLEELFISAPLWFHEGMATYFSGQMGYERFLLYLRESLVNPRSDLFRMGYQYPRNRQDWPRFYTSSAMAVRFMQEKHKPNWQSFWDYVALSHKRGQKIRFNEAFVRCYHTSLWDFQRSFERYSRRQGYLYLVVAANSLIFALLPFVMLLIARKRRRRMQKLPDLPEPEQDPHPQEKEALDD